MNTRVLVSTETRPVSRAALFLLLLVGGQLIFVFGSPYFTVFPTNDNTLCLLYTSPSPRDRTRSRIPSSASNKKKNQSPQHITA